MKTILLQRRIEAGLTQLQVANKANITVRNYQRIEHGAQEPRQSTAQLLAKALNSTVEELFPIDNP